MIKELNLIEIACFVVFHFYKSEYILALYNTIAPIKLSFTAREFPQKNTKQTTRTRAKHNMPPPRTSVPYAFTASTTDCPVLCSLLLDRHQLPRRLVANLRPPLLRVKINSLYTVCQETSTSNVALRLHCLRPDMRCVCLSMIQFMYISGDSAMPRPDPMDRTGQTSHHHHHRGESFNWWVLFYLIPLLMMVALLLGILKASCGCCGSSISSWKYDYMQPLHPFSRASWYALFMAYGYF